MDKKLLTGAIASAVAVAGFTPDAQAGPNDRNGLDNPLDIESCTFDEDGFSAHWEDPNEEGVGSHYGGDLELAVACATFCEADEESFDGFTETKLEFDLSQDAEDPFSYVCESVESAELADAVVCWADLSWNSVNEALDDLEESIAENASCDGEFFVACEAFPEDGGSVFSVKDMNPGNKGGGKQNYVKAFKECEPEEFFE